jgi:hypothetical protein
LHVGSAGAGHVDGRGSAVALGNLELDSLTVGKGAEALGVNAGLVNEQVLLTAGRGDESEALLGIEPFAGSCCEEQ